eukprot:m.34941 g.34941  ORF g.34941 m.34941 type:complete len:215 (+) comp9834_c0_seq2:378-1022(+)
MEDSRALSLELLGLVQQLMDEPALARVFSGKELLALLKRSRKLCTRDALKVANQLLSQGCLRHVGSRSSLDLFLASTFSDSKHRLYSWNTRMLQDFVGPDDANCYSQSSTHSAPHLELTLPTSSVHHVQPYATRLVGKSQLSLLDAMGSHSERNPPKVKPRRGNARKKKKEKALVPPHITRKASNLLWLVDSGNNGPHEYIGLMGSPTETYGLV